ncbi:hypothetical protein BOTBODRAFT_173312 [Botryobasidium botryosum FD-172 SS1]|uniref:Uncharacterized protein n=1 Tax=Botryobasidium botryosum (strain FD-172 SS1) TaxID=930990 RepID=A0A067MMS3_BOTB1|nr:hypothetical protein BOTBODRAFT_173312 [Botryobasidium botryosum FD-172 SS1]
MTACAFDYSSANCFNPSPARCNESRSFRTSLVFFLNLAASLFITSACWLAAYIAWLFCLFFTVLYNLLLEGDDSSTVAPPLVSATTPDKKGLVLARPPATTPQDVAKDQASISAVHPRPAPSNYAASRVHKPATPYRGAPQCTFTINATRRAPDASFAPGSSIFTLEDMGMVQAQGSNRVVAERKEVGWESARHAEVQRRVDHLAAAATSAPQAAPSSLGFQAPALVAETLVPASIDISHLSVINNSTSASHALTPLVAAPSLAVANDAEDMDWVSHPLQPEPEHAQLEDVSMDDDFSSPSDEPMDDTPSLASAFSSLPATPSPVFPAVDFVDVIVTCAEEDAANITSSLRACSLSDAECASPALPSMDAEFPALDEVAAALSACLLAEHFGMEWMDANGDVAMEGDDDDSDNDDEDGMPSGSLLEVACSAPAFPPMDVDVAGDMGVECDNLSAREVAISSVFGSRGHVSHLVKRHQRTRARVEHAPHDSTPPPKPNVTVLRLVNKYADFGTDVEGVMFRVQLDIGLGKAVKVSRMAC